MRAAACAAGTKIEVQALSVPEAKAEIARGDLAAHDKLIVEAVEKRQFSGTILLGQVSMGGVLSYFDEDVASRTLLSAKCTVHWLARHFGART